MKLKKLTPNLVVTNVKASLDFYCHVLGFQLGGTFPEAPPYAFGSVISEKGRTDGVEIFFNAQTAVTEDYPALAAKPIGGSLSLFIEVEGIQEILAAVTSSGAKITMPLKDQFYGMREFAFEAPEGWIVTVAEKIA